MTLTWSAPTGTPPVSYIIEAGSSSGLANLANFATGNALTIFQATGIGSGTYFVRVRAVTASGTSDVSNEATLIVGGPPTCVIPGRPSSFTLTGNGGGVVSFSWIAASGSPTSYIVEAGSATGLADLANSDLGSANTSFTASGVGTGKYYVRIRAKNACGISESSNELTIVVSPNGFSTILVQGTLAFGAVPIGSTRTAIATIYNGGNRNLTITNITVPTGFKVSPTSGTVGPLQSVPVTVTFAPSAATSYTGLLTVSSDATSGNGTLDVSGVGSQSAPAFGAGTYVVGRDIPQGRYFSRPPSTGCQWALQDAYGNYVASGPYGQVSGASGTQQIVVDILPSDYSFVTNAACGSWSISPTLGGQSNIGPGEWVVGAQVTPGSYHASIASYGGPDSPCSAAVLSGFRDQRSFIGGQTDWPKGGGTSYPIILGMTVGPADTAFVTTGCGTWLPGPAPARAMAVTPTTFDFGTPTFSTSKSFTITNTGGAPLYIYGITRPPAAGSSVTWTTSTGLLAGSLGAGASMTVTITVTPTSRPTYHYNEMIAVTSNASDLASSQAVVSFSGTW